jgi:Fe2+ transport system protein FeoA
MIDTAGPSEAGQGREAVLRIIRTHPPGERDLPKETGLSGSDWHDNAEQPVEEPLETLANLNPGEEATVVRLSLDCRGLERRRLMDLGLLPGTVVAAEMRSPTGDPTAFRIRGALIALRVEQAGYIQITSRRKVA